MARKSFNKNTILLLSEYMKEPIRSPIVYNKEGKKGTNSNKLKKYFYGDKIKKRLIVFFISIILFAFIINYISLNVEISNKNEELKKIRNDLEIEKKNHNSTINKLEEDKKLISNFEKEISNKDLTIDSLNNQLNLYMAGTKFDQHNPTFQEVINFLKEDKTDEVEYTDKEYTCLDYAAEVNNNAENKGIRSYVVELYFEEGAHAIIGFDTIDEGRIYFEPQNDCQVKNLKIGNDYWKECIVPPEGYEYATKEKSIIERMVTYW